MSKLCLQRKMKKLYLCSIITFDLHYMPTSKYHLLAHIQLINLLYNEVKNLTWICCKGPKSVSSRRKMKKLYLCSIITFDLHYIPTSKYHLLAHIQLINLLYNEVKNLTWICCKGLKSVSSKINL